VRECYVRILLRRNDQLWDEKQKSTHYIKLPPWRIFHYIKLLCNNCPYILKCQNKLIMKKNYLDGIFYLLLFKEITLRCFPIRSNKTFALPRSIVLFFDRVSLIYCSSVFTLLRTLDLYSLCDLLLLTIFNEYLYKS